MHRVEQGLTAVTLIVGRRRHVAVPICFQHFDLAIIENLQNPIGPLQRIACASVHALHHHICGTCDERYLANPASLAVFSSPIKLLCFSVSLPCAHDVHKHAAVGAPCAPIAYLWQLQQQRAHRRRERVRD